MRDRVASFDEHFPVTWGFRADRARSRWHLLDEP
jgi:hypothetical protein